MTFKWYYAVAAIVIAYVIWANFIQKATVKTSVANNAGMV